MRPTRYPAGMTQAWRTIVLLYPVLDARYGSGLGRTRAQRVMGRAERAVIEGVIERLPATILGWSEGAATLAPVDVIEVRRRVTSLSSSGGGRWWVGPRECREELETWVAPDRYDSVVALWPCTPEVPQCGWGCTIGPGEATFGAGFSSISTDHWETLAMDPDPEQGYVHEWLHQVEATYRALGLSEAALPPLHDAGAYTSTRGSDVAPFGRSFAEYHDGWSGGGVVAGGDVVAGGGVVAGDGWSGGGVGAGGGSVVAGDGWSGGGVVAGARTWAPWYRDWMTGRLRPAGSDPGWSGEPIGLTAERWARRTSR